MHRKGVFIFLAAILWLGIGIKAAHAQSDTPRYEVSGVVTSIRQDENFYQIDADLIRSHPHHFFGVGGMCRRGDQLAGIGASAGAGHPAGTAAVWRHA